MTFRKLALIVLAAGSLFAAGKIFPYSYVQEDLPNGLRLITIPTDYPNIVSLFIVVGTGSRNEVEPGKSGFAHLFEHLMFRGIARIFSGHAISRICRERAPPRTPSRPTISPPSTPHFQKRTCRSILSMEADRFQHLDVRAGCIQDRNPAPCWANTTRTAPTRARSFPKRCAPRPSTRTLTNTPRWVSSKDIKAMPDEYDYSRAVFRPLLPA